MTGPSHAKQTDWKWRAAYERGRLDMLKKIQDFVTQELEADVIKPTGLLRELIEKNEDDWLDGHAEDCEVYGPTKMCTCGRKIEPKDG